MKIQIYCDNEPAVQVINSGKAKVPFLAACIRELWLVISTFKFELRAVHLPGVENRAADCLSRWEESYVYRDLFFDCIQGCQYQEVHVTPSCFQFSDFL